MIKGHADADHVLDVIRLMKNQNIDKKCILTSDIQLSVNIIKILTQRNLYTSRTVRKGI